MIYCPGCDRDTTPIEGECPDCGYTGECWWCGNEIDENMADEDANFCTPACAYRANREQAALAAAEDRSLGL